MRFYQHFWQMLHQDFIDIFLAFYEGHLGISHFNRAYIALMPKLVGARCIGDFRPISLINGILKIISKVLVGRLKKKINDLIDPSQSAFLHGCSILDSVASVQEIISACTKYNWSAYFLNWTLLKLLTRLIESLSSKFSILVG